MYPIFLAQLTFMEDDDAPILLGLPGVAKKHQIMPIKKAGSLVVVMEAARIPTPL